MEYRTNRFSAGALTKFTKSMTGNMVQASGPQKKYYPMTGNTVQNAKSIDQTIRDKNQNTITSVASDEGNGPSDASIEWNKITYNTFQSPRENPGNGSIDLQDAIIWSEILGKPLCKRRKRRYYGD